MPRHWFIKTKSGKVGPVTSKQLQKLVREGKVNPRSGVSHNGEDWFKAKRVNGLPFPSRTRDGEIATETKKPATEDRWFVQTKGGNAGPFTVPKIKKLIKQGRVKRDVLVSVDGKDWIKAKRIPGIEFPSSGLTKPTKQPPHAAEPEPEPQPQPPATEEVLEAADETNSSDILETESGAGVTDTIPPSETWDDEEVELIPEPWTDEEILKLDEFTGWKPTDDSDSGSDEEPTPSNPSDQVLPGLGNAPEQPEHEWAPDSIIEIDCEPIEDISGTAEAPLPELDEESELSQPPPEPPKPETVEVKPMFVSSRQRVPDTRETESELRLADSKWASRREEQYLRFFGAYSEIDRDARLDPFPIDVYVHPPNQVRPVTTLVTSGMSDFPMPIPDPTSHSRRTELIMYADEANPAYIRIMRFLAKSPHRKRTWLAYGSMMNNGEPARPIFKHADLDGYVFMVPNVESDFMIHQSLHVEDEPVQMLWVLPTTSLERQLISTQGMGDFCSLLDRNNHGLTINPRRGCFVSVPSQLPVETHNPDQSLSSLGLI